MSCSRVNRFQPNVSVRPIASIVAARISVVYCTEYTGMPSSMLGISPPIELIFVPSVSPKNAKRLQPIDENAICVVEFSSGRFIYSTFAYARFSPTLRKCCAIHSGRYIHVRSRVRKKKPISVGNHRRFAIPNVLIHEYRRNIFCHSPFVASSTTVYSIEIVFISV